MVSTFLVAAVLVFVFQIRFIDLPVLLLLSYYYYYYYYYYYFFFESVQALDRLRDGQDSVLRRSQRFRV